MFQVHSLAQITSEKAQRAEDRRYSGPPNDSSTFTAYYGSPESHKSDYLPHGPPPPRTRPLGVRRLSGVRRSAQHSSFRSDSSAFTDPEGLIFPEPDDLPEYRDHAYKVPQLTTVSSSDSGAEDEEDWGDNPDQRQRQNLAQTTVIVDDDRELSDVTTGSVESLSKDVHAFLKRGMLFANRKKDRLVEKDGEFRISYGNVEKRGRSYLKDFFTTMLEMQWRYLTLLFLFVFVISWVFFALIWYLIDIIDYEIYTSGTSVERRSDYQKCVDGVDDFSSALLFSIETQHTIGYGTRAMTTACPTSYIILMLQSMYGAAMQCVLTGIIFAKMSRPIRRAKTIMFSKNAVICQRDGDLCLMFRVGDMRKSSLLSVNIQALYVTRRTTEEGEDIPIAQKQLQLSTESDDDLFFVAWPILVLHRIDHNSPLWEISAEQLLMAQFEIVVVLECVAEMTGASMQVIRASYFNVGCLF